MKNITLILILVISNCILVAILVGSYILLNKQVENDKTTLTQFKSLSGNKSQYSQESATGILYCIASASLVKRYDVVEVLLENSQDWCEAGFRVSVIIDTYDLIAPIEFSTALERKMKCTKSKMTIQVVPHPLYDSKGEATNLVTFHRKHFASNTNNFDIFVFGEDDMSIRLASINRWLIETQKLHSLASNYAVGLVRYENAMLLLRNKKNRDRVETLASTENKELYDHLQVQDRKKPVPSGVEARQHAASSLTSTGAMPPQSSPLTVTPMNKVTWEFSLSELSLISSSSVHSERSVWVPGLPDNHFVTLGTGSGSTGRDAVSTTISTESVVGPHSISQKNKTHFQINKYSATTILTRQQMLSLESRCQYLSNQTAHKLFPTHASQLRVFYVSSQIYQCGKLESIANSGIFDVYSPEFFCCMHWVLPVSNFDALFVHHIGTPGDNADLKWANKHRISKSATVDMWHDAIEKMK